MTEEQRKIKILFVEDELAIRENISEILQDEGFEVVEAVNGKDGFGKFLKTSPDIIISDVMMPDIDGHAFLKLVRESKSVKNSTIPFIFLSALGQKTDIIKAAAGNANDYLIKPVDFDVLIAKVREKTANLMKIKELHKKDINNIKNQVSAILPSELMQYVDNINAIVKNLRGEPYGPLPHRLYLEDLNRIYFDSVKLRSLISSSLDSKVIDIKLNVNEEIFTISTLISEFLASLNKKCQGQIEFESPFEEELLPKIKDDKFILIDSLRSVVSALINLDNDCLIRISSVFDHLDQIVIIFYLNPERITEEKWDIDKINGLFDRQNYRIEARCGKANNLNITLVIPNYKIIK